MGSYKEEFKKVKAKMLSTEVSGAESMEARICPFYAVDQ